MSAIDFGVDHKFYPAGRTPEELSVGFLVANPNSPSDFLRLSNAPPSVITETLNPIASLDAKRKDAIETHIKSFLGAHYKIDVEKSGEVEAVKMIRERLNNITPEILKAMLGTPAAIAFLTRIAEQHAKRSKLKSWKRVFFNLDPWLVVSTQTFYDGKADVKSGKAVEGGVEVTAPVATALTHGASDDGNLSVAYQHEQTSTTKQSGHHVDPLVFAAKYQQVRYKLVDDQLASCYLLEDESVPVGFFSGDDSNGDGDPIKSAEDIVAFVEKGAIEVEFADS
ncbi:hypothetical protein FALBO_1559 [Fusarium albosuccineum]|uniref:Uncharacterized protein n=1 Tax=Fusarium albosuccineum TaxID=1237068 RepID=A0A8H4LMZ0_9HYPO|nr:hypothetical protein FALBO_1559 [Fusarium albosuccineum]